MTRGRLWIALVIAAISLLGYFGKSTFNPITEEKQHVGSVTPEQEIALGLQAAPEMVHQFGGLDPDPRLQNLVDRVGEQLVSRSAAKLTPYQFDFHALDDSGTINAFALPGGQIFITEGLLRQLDTEGQLAGVLGHEIGHVVARHGAEHIAKQQLTQGLTGAAVLATYDPNDPSTQQSAAVAAMIGQLVTMRFGRQDELESDALGVRFTSEAGYDPNSMIRLMEVLEESSSGQRQPEFFSTTRIPRTVSRGSARRSPSGSRAACRVDSYGSPARDEHARTHHLIDLSDCICGLGSTALRTTTQKAGIGAKPCPLDVLTISVTPNFDDATQGRPCFPTSRWPAATCDRQQ